MKWPFVEIFSVSMSFTHGIMDPWMEAQSGNSICSIFIILLEDFVRYSLGSSFRTFMLKSIMLTL